MLLFPSDKPDSWTETEAETLCLLLLLPSSSPGEKETQLEEQAELTWG